MRSSSDRRLGHLESSGLCSRSAEDEKGSVKDMLARPVSKVDKQCSSVLVALVVQFNILPGKAANLKQQTPARISVRLG
jgi:hypothetical protein